MRSTIIFLIFLSFQNAMVFAQSIEEKSTRERVTVIEQRLEKMDESIRTISETVNRTDQRLTTISDTPHHWYCSAHCVKGYKDGSWIYVGPAEGEGNSSKVAFKEMTNHCESVVYIDFAHTFATVANACAKD